MLASPRDVKTIEAVVDPEAEVDVEAVVAVAVVVVAVVVAAVAVVAQETERRVFGPPWVK